MRDFVDWAESNGYDASDPTTVDLWDDYWRTDVQDLRDRQREHHLALEHDAGGINPPDDPAPRPDDD